MPRLLDTLRHAGRLPAMLAILALVVPLIAACIPPAEAEDAAFEAAVRAGIVCANAPGGSTAPTPDPAGRQHDTQCIQCLMGCPFGGGLPPPAPLAAIGLSVSLAGFVSVRPEAVATSALVRPVSDIAMRAPPRHV